MTHRTQNTGTQNTEHRMKPRLILSLLALLACSHVAHAALVFDISEEIISPTQTNIVIHGYGSADIDGLTVETEGNRGSEFIPLTSLFLSWVLQQPSTHYLILYKVLGHFFLNFSNTTAQTFGYTAYYPALIVPQGYISGEALENTMTIFNLNFLAAGLSAGESYSVSWAEGTADEDSLTVNIVPEPSSILLIGTASGLLALARQKRKTLAVH